MTEKGVNKKSLKALENLLMGRAKDHEFMQKIGWEKPGEFPTTKETEKTIARMRKRNK